MPSISQSCSYGSANRFATFYFSRPIHPFIGEIITSLGDKGIIKPTSAKYLSGFLAKKSSQRTDYDPKLVNCSIFRHHPSQLYDEVLCIEKNSINLYFELIPTWISESYLEVCMDIALITRDITNPNPKDAGLFNFYKLIINESLVQMSVNQAIQPATTSSSSGYSSTPTPTFSEKQFTVASTKKHFCLQLSQCWRSKLKSTYL